MYLTKSPIVLPEKERRIKPTDIPKSQDYPIPNLNYRSGPTQINRYVHVFPAPGETVTRRTQEVRHDIETNGSRSVWCGSRHLAPAGLRTEQKCIKEMLEGGQIEPSDSPWASPVVLVTKKDGSMRFCVDYRRLNSLTVKDTNPLPRIDDSLHLLGNQQWFSTMDMASEYWHVAMSLDTK